MCLNPRITQTVMDNLENFHNITGGTLFNMFSYIGWSGKYGDWVWIISFLYLLS